MKSNWSVSFKTTISLLVFWLVALIYLIPELVFLTGLEHGTNSDDNTTRRKITSKTKMRPGDKINAIRSIYNLLNSTNNKIYMNKQGKEVKLKSAKEMQDVYGINIGNNLTVNVRVYFWTLNSISLTPDHSILIIVAL